MYVGSEDYDKAVAFLNGYDLACGDCDRPTLFDRDDGTNFYDWLCERVGVESHPALSWWHLVLFDLPGLERNRHGQPVLPSGRNPEAIQTLSKLLSEYLGIESASL